ncbi:DUF2855 family protein [Microbulbifer agarilyticus]|uniref:DUF2855 family protein n=1 Tax=Microbulbifer agarilyticus TaxID=260552 RepID=UPI001CD284E1|nr:DUF2855 family protein [Microbulbifer agarilyticus]MCA0900307.1 DUF2855 family protein [Microbulbifer agarilyticus]
MASCTELWVDRKDFRKTRTVGERDLTAGDGQVLVAIDKFGLTANNVSYALSGEMIGYWGYFPAEDQWGKVPVWACGTVVESHCPEVPVGERLWGFFPMASHTVLTPGKVREDQFMDMAEHRQALPAMYNAYRRTQAEPDILTKLENERCLLFPLFATSFVLYDYLIDNALFGAEQVIIGSVSSKTGFGLAHLLHRNSEISAKVVGVTSAGNTAFVRDLGCCDQVVNYGEESQIDASLRTAYIDMSGNVTLTRALHQHIGDNIVESAMVGASHWEGGGAAGDLPGAKPTFFFAPGQIAKRDKEWGPGAMMQKAMMASAEIATATSGNLKVEWLHGPEALDNAWQQLLDNQVGASRGLMVSLLD